MDQSDAQPAFEKENEILQRQLAAAQTRIRALESAVARADERFNTFTSTLPGISWETWGRPDEVPVSYISPSISAWTGHPVEKWYDKPGFWLELAPPEDREKARREIIELAASTHEHGIQEYRWLTADQRTLWIQVRFTIVRDELGVATVWQAFSLDITAQKCAEIERDGLASAQSQLLARLSTPLIPVSDDVMVMPLIGPVDRNRANRALDVLLEGIARQRTRVAILDVTGVPSVDEDVVETLLRAARAARLLGVEVLLTGIRSDVAQAFCTYGHGLAEMTTCATLQQGIARAMKVGRTKW